jgi:hypothetical protein
MDRGRRPPSRTGPDHRACVDGAAKPFVRGATRQAHLRHGFFLLSLVLDDQVCIEKQDSNVAEGECSALGRGGELR